MGKNVKAQQSWDMRYSTDSITQGGGVTTYTAGDVISEVTTNDHYTFANVCDEITRTGTIVSCAVLIDEQVATGPDLELWLFHTDIAEVADNGAFAVTIAEMANCIGVIDIPTAGWKLAGTASNYQIVTGLNLPFRLNSTSGTRALYGQLVTRNAYNPNDDEIFTVTLGIRQD